MAETDPAQRSIKVNDFVKSVGEYLLKTKFIEGHRRQVGIALNALTVASQWFPSVASFIPALGNPVVQHFLLTAGSYIAIIGELFKNESAASAATETK